LFPVPGILAASQKAAVDLGLQGLDAPVQDFRETGIGGDLRYRQPGGLKGLGRPAGGQDSTIPDLSVTLINALRVAAMMDPLLGPPVKTGGKVYFSQICTVSYQGWERRSRITAGKNSL
jgi:hypothetical protein